MEILSTCTKSAGSRSSGFQVIFSVLKKQLVGPDAATMTRPGIFLLSDSVIYLEKVWSRGSDMAVTLVPKTDSTPFSESSFAISDCIRARSII